MQPCHIPLPFDLHLEEVRRVAGTASDPTSDGDRRMPKGGEEEEEASSACCRMCHLTGTDWRVEGETPREGLYVPARGGREGVGEAEGTAYRLVLLHIDLQLSVLLGDQNIAAKDEMRQEGHQGSGAMQVKEWGG